ncbi:MAG: hypothetical protein IT269_01945 [Saprospiraceae bacterium]|nr:hypothetical protein [Saprospiraceae bacterium]
MKFFCYIFSLYFLALSTMPCTDVHDMNPAAGNELASISTNSHENCPHEKGNDDCSPFCVCSCCGHNFLETRPVKWIFQPPTFFEYKGKCSFSYSRDWQSEYLKSIFRPPKV